MIQAPPHPGRQSPGLVVLDEQDERAQREIQVARRCEVPAQIVVAEEYEGDLDAVEGEDGEEMEHFLLLMPDGPLCLCKENDVWVR